MNRDWQTQTILGIFVAVVVGPLVWQFAVSSGKKRSRNTATGQAIKRLADFRGKWEIDLPLSMDRAAAESGGSPLTTYRHSPITVNDNRITFGHDSEYLLFDLHEHDGFVCGKAWYHESIHDPGDMSKCYVRLRKLDDRLLFRIRMQDGMVDINDPDLEYLMKNWTGTFAGSKESCRIESPPDSGWGEWSIFVFKRKK